MTDLKIWQDAESKTINFKGSYSYNDLLDLDLLPSDKELLRNLPELASEKLLILEIIFRRIEEYRQRKSEESAMNIGAIKR